MGYNCFRRLMKSTILALCLANSVLLVAADERAAGTLSEMLAKIRSEEFENNFFVGDAFLEKPLPGKESAAGCILDKACGQWCMRFTWWQEVTLPDCCICLENIASVASQSLTCWKVYNIWLDSVYIYIYVCVYMCVWRYIIWIILYIHAHTCTFCLSSGPRSIHKWWPCKTGGRHRQRERCDRLCEWPSGGFGRLLHSRLTGPEALGDPDFGT